jgi:hypothetical protein
LFPLFTDLLDIKGQRPFYAHKRFESSRALQPSSDAMAISPLSPQKRVLLQLANL